jgi:hypothetical protein
VFFGLLWKKAKKNSRKRDGGVTEMALTIRANVNKKSQNDD